MEQDASYKQLHELFVSGSDGTTLLEIATVVSGAPLVVFLRDAAAFWLVGKHSANQALSVSQVVAKLFVDHLILIIPLCLLFTVLVDQVETVLTAIFCIAAGLCVFGQTLNSFMQTKNKKSASASWSEILNIPVADKLPFITNFRAFVNVATAISILAVDFTIFPRRFAKAETYGTGLMDVGVGAFIISNAMVSPEARGKYKAQGSLKGKVSSVVQSTVSSIPLVVLGLVRLLAVKSSDYQEHASEYGTHWNFFLTLAVVKVMSSVVLCVMGSQLSWLISLFIAAGYQYTLSHCGVRDFILNGWDGEGTRSDLVSANREGLCSCFGYLSLYFAGVQLGKYLFQPRPFVRDWLRALLVLGVVDAIFWVLLEYSQVYIEPVSRRMANLPFILWIVAYNLQLVPSFLLVDVTIRILKHTGFLASPHSDGVGPSGGGGDKASALGGDKASAGGFCLLEAVNRNGLFYFLLANLLTGLINMSMDTIHAPTNHALGVVLIYMFVLTLASAFLHVKNVTLKFW